MLTAILVVLILIFIAEIPAYRMMRDEFRTIHDKLDCLKSQWRALQDNQWDVMKKHMEKVHGIK